MNKVVQSASDAIADITSGSTLAVGGFGLCGIPDALLAAINEGDATDLEVYSNNCGVDDYGLGMLLSAGRIRRVTASYVGENKEFARQYLSGELEVELTQQGTLAEKLRAGGAGIPAFFTPAGVGTLVSEGGLPWRYHADGSVAVASPPKETRQIRGRTYVLEESITADFALVHAEVGDTEGNLVFNKTAMNFNPSRRDGGAGDDRAGRDTRRARQDRSGAGAPARCLRAHCDDDRARGDHRRELRLLAAVRRAVTA
jgi:3-oxoacid CoA-transferase subunit A